MKITVERDRLTKALSFASRLIEGKPTIPILGNLLISAGKNSVTIKANDLTMQATCVMPADVVGTANIPAITVPGKLVASTVANFPSGSQVTLEWEDQRTVIMRAGRARYRLLALPASDFPDLPEPEDAVTFKISAKTFDEALSSCEFAILDGLSRIDLAGMCWQIEDPDGHGGLGGHKGNKLIFVATDARELGYVPMDIPDGAEEMPTVIVPGRAIDEMQRLAHGADGEVEISVTPERATIRVGDISLTTKVVEAEYPDYMRVIPEDGYLPMVADVKDMDAALTRLVNIGEGARATLHTSQGNVTFKLANADAGDAEESVAVEWNDGEISKKINASSFIKIIRKIKTELVSIRFNAPARGILFNEFASEKIIYTRTFLSMPMEGS